jgi:hypothetical protein
MSDLDYRTLRLLDLGRDEMIEVRCVCGWTTHYAPGFLQRRHRMPSDMLIFDLQFRVRCSHCSRRNGFAIQVINSRVTTMKEDHPPKVIVLPESGP